MATDRVDLGFVNDDCDSRLLKSHYFPSKVGGKPAWLSLNHIPKTEQLSCPKCQNQMTFLLQTYSPRSKEDAFHRTLFIFACKTPACCAPNKADTFKVFRSQLPCMNPFFSADPPPDDPAEDTEAVPSAAKYQPLCVVCGCYGSKHCSQCKVVNYCSKDHQTRHWKSEHKKSCGKQVSVESGADEPANCRVLFPEFELEIEEEDYSPDKTVKDEAKAMEEFEQCKQAGAAPGAEYSEKDLELMEGMASNETDDDRQFKKFQKRVAQNKEQVLRYCKGGEPLWVSNEHKATPGEIPDCSCGAPREFEFQVMPQLLNFLGVDDVDGNSLDWGTLCVYTCRDACSIGNTYVMEFIWKQDFCTSR